MIIRLANRYIEINNLYHFIEDYCNDYMIKDTQKLQFLTFVLTLSEKTLTLSVPNPPQKTEKKASPSAILQTNT